MAMIRVELESERRRLPLYLAISGIAAIVVAVVLYGIDRQVGLLRIVDLQQLRNLYVQDQVDTNQRPGATIREEPSAAAVVVDSPSSVGMTQAAIVTPSPLPVVGTAGTPSSVAVPISWGKSAPRLRPRLSSKITVTRQQNLADGTFQITGRAEAEHHESLRQDVAALRSQGLRPTLTFWREGGEAAVATFIVSGQAGSDAPQRPPLRASMPVDALLQLAQGHARAAGLVRMASTRPTHEQVSAGNTRVEQGMSAVGNPRQIAMFGTALAAESQARLTRFDIAAVERGLFRVTASIDVLLGKENR